MLRSLGAPISPPREGSFAGQLWQTNNPEDIIDFLGSLKTHPDARKARAFLLAKYVAARNAANELREWYVGLAAGGEESYLIGGQTVKLVKREAVDEDATVAGRYRIKRLVSPKDESVDLDAEELRRALLLTQQAWMVDPGRSKRTTAPEIPSGQAIRHVRPAERGLLLLYPLATNAIGTSERSIIGFAISFPHSKGISTIRYMVNNVYWQQEIDEL